MHVSVFGIWKWMWHPEEAYTYIGTRSFVEKWIYWTRLVGIKVRWFAWEEQIRLLIESIALSPMFMCVSKRVRACSPFKNSRKKTQKSLHPFLFNSRIWSRSIIHTQLEAGKSTQIETDYNYCHKSWRVHVKLRLFINNTPYVSWVALRTT